MSKPEFAPGRINEYELRILAGNFADAYRAKAPEPQNPPPELTADHTTGKPRPYQAGWPVAVPQGAWEELNTTKSTICVAPIGHFNAGKTWVTNRLSGKELPCGDTVHTEGLSIAVTPFANGKLQIAWMDTAGLQSPVSTADPNDTIPPVMGQPEENNKIARANMDRLEKQLRDLKRVEEFHRLTAFEFANVYLFIIGQMSFQDQIEILALIQQIQNAGKKSKSVYVVHNLRTWSLAQLMEKPSEEAVKRGSDGNSYIERVEKLFFMQHETVPMNDFVVYGDVKTETVVPWIDGKAAPAGKAEHRLSSKLPKLFGTFGERADSLVTMQHVFLCDDNKGEKEREYNAGVFAYLRTCVEGVIAQPASVKGLLEEVMNSVQLQLAEVPDRSKPPKLSIVETPNAPGKFKHAVHAVDAAGKPEDAAVVEQPLDLPSYLTLGGDDLQFNIVKLEGRGADKLAKQHAAAAAAGGAGKPPGTKRDLYGIQLVLPGLKREEVEEIKKKMVFNSSTLQSALRLETVEGRRVLTVDFMTVERVAHPRVVEKLQHAYTKVEGEGVVTIMSREQTMEQEGTRAVFKPVPLAAGSKEQELLRTVPVQLRTGLDKVSALVKPMVAYNDGILTIAVAVAANK